jgi:hypothetical protein
MLVFSPALNFTLFDTYIQIKLKSNQGTYLKGQHDYHRFNFVT